MKALRAVGILALAAALLGLALGTASGQQAARTVQGVVASGSAGGSSELSGHTVTLHRVTMTGYDDVTTVTDADGAFSFDDFPYDQSVRYGVSVRYQGAIYGTDLDLSGGSPEPVELRVYESTSDDGIVSAGSASLLLAAADATDQTLAALEIIRLVNRTDTTYVPGEGVMELLRFGLPPGATELALDTPLIGADFVQVDRGFALLASVPPGEHDVMFSYRFPYESDSFSLDKTYRYGAESLRVLAPEEVVTISARGLGEPEAVQIGERQYRVFESSGIERGGAVSVLIEDLPMPSLSDRLGGGFSSVRFEYAAPVTLVLLMLGLLGYGAIWRRASA